MPKVHKGYTENSDGKRTSCRWVETTMKLEAERQDLLNGLGSRYFRNESLSDDDPVSARPDDLPTTLTALQILRIYREELLDYGTRSLWTWVEDLGARRGEHAERWLGELVDQAFPDLRVNSQES